MSKSKSYKYYALFEYIIAFCIILNCHSIFIANSTFVKYINVFFFQILLIMFVLYKLNIMNITKRLKNLIYIFIFLFIIYICILFAFNFKVSNFYFLFINLCLDPILFIICILMNKSNKLDLTIFIRLENVVLFLAIASLILWLLSRIDLIHHNVSIISTWNNSGYSENVNGYFYLLFLPQGYRNCGIFVESPMYSYVLCISLFIELFMKRHSNEKIFTWRFFILFLTLISTFSTTGLMVSLPLIMYKILISNINIIKKIGSVILIPVVWIILKMALMNKMSNITNLNSSYNTRMNDITSAVSAWKQHPIIGNGLGNELSIQNHMYWFRLLPGGNRGISTGFFNVLALGGILFALFYVIPTILVLFMGSYNEKGIAIFNFILFIYTSIPFTYLCILMFSYLIACCLRQNNKKYSENNNKIIKI